jgi:hypothetical protein
MPHRHVRGPTSANRHRAAEPIRDSRREELKASSTRTHPNDDMEEMGFSVISQAETLQLAGGRVAGARLRSANPADPGTGTGIGHSDVGAEVPRVALGVAPYCFPAPACTTRRAAGTADFAAVMTLRVLVWIRPPAGTFGPQDSVHPRTRHTTATWLMPF